MHEEALAKLSARQAECLRLVSRDRDAKEIARILGISDETVERHIKLAMRKLGLGSRFAAARALAEFEGRTHPVVMPLHRAQTTGMGVGRTAADGTVPRQEAGRDELREARAAFGHSAPAEVSDLSSYDHREVRNLLSAPMRLGLCVIAFIALAIGLAGVGATMQQLSKWIHEQAVAKG